MCVPAYMCVYSRNSVYTENRRFTPIAPFQSNTQGSLWFSPFSCLLLLLSLVFPTPPVLYGQLLVPASLHRGPPHRAWPLHSQCPRCRGFPVCTHTPILGSCVLYHTAVPTLHRACLRGPT